MCSRRYERGHWDSAIQQYRETELVDEDENLKAILHPLRRFLEENHTRSSCSNGTKSFTGSWLPCHTIDLDEKGSLNAHVDSIRFSGNLVAGLSLLSSSVMRLKPADATSHGSVDLYLPPWSLYVLSGVSRYEYTHELLPSGSFYQGNSVERGQRLSVIFRDAKVQDTND